MIDPENDHPAEMLEQTEMAPDELLAAYALHALAPEEILAVEAYLATHPEAVDEVTVLKEAVAMLPYGVPSQAPSPGLRLRLMARVYQEALEERGERPRAQQPVPIRRARAGLLWPFAAAILLFLTVGFGGWATALHRDVSQKDQVIATQRSAIGQAGVTSPLVGTAPNATTRGEVLKLANTQAAVLTITGLPPLANGKVYEVWFIAGTTPVGAGLFSPNADGSWSGLVRGDVITAQAIAITIEPFGGSITPTGAIVAEGSL